MVVKRMMPHTTCVSLKAKPINTGVKVPSVSMPTMLRRNRISITPMGIIRIISKVC